MQNLEARLNASEQNAQGFDNNLNTTTTEANLNPTGKKKATEETVAQGRRKELHEEQRQVERSII